MSSAEAVERARTAAGVEEPVKARVWRVRRLDRADAYYLVAFDKCGSTVAVATVHATSGDVGTMARLPGVSAHIDVDEAGARTLAGASGDAEVAMVWRPGSASRSPLYPLWEVTTQAGPVYVDQQGNVLREPP